MAKIGDTEAASRYDGLLVGPRLDYTFETQSGVPVDGTSAFLRVLSPFTLRIVLPDAILEAAANHEDSNSTSVDLITAASLGANQNSLAGELSTYVSRVSPVEHGQPELSSFVSDGQFQSDQGSSVYATLADALQAADVALQLQRILDMPPLTMLVNPKEMTISYTSLQTYASRTRYGFVFERWGEDQPSINFQGSTPAFMAGAATAPGTDPYALQAGGETTSPSGLQFASKRDSAAWQNFISLFHFYRSNGYIYDLIGKSEAHLMVGAVAIDYDQWTYVGHIESFEYSYDEGMPHRVEWSMEFRVDRMYDNATSVFSVLPQTAPTASPSNPNGMSTSAWSISDMLSNTTTTDGTVGSAMAEVPFNILGS